MVRWLAIVLVLVLVSVLAPEIAGAQRGSVRLGAIETVGAVSKKAAKGRILKALASLEACVVDEEGEPKVSGKAVFRSLVAPDGKTLASEVASSSLGDRGVERCLGAALEAVRYPEAEEHRDTHLHVELLVGDARRPSGEERRPTAGPGDPEWDEERDPTPEVPDAPSSPEVLVQLRALAGQLTQSSLERATSRAVRAFRACYEPRLAAKPGLAGRIGLRSELSPKGESRKLTVTLTTLPADLTRCVARAAALIPFEAPSGPVVVEWAVVLAPPRGDH